MYNPTPFKIEDASVFLRFVEEYGFATIVSSSQMYPMASHTPLLIEKVGENYMLKGHLAKANEHTRLFRDKSDVLVIFQGPHGYVSSYAKDPEELSILPTWDYQIIHAKGQLSMMDDFQLAKFMRDLTEKYERHQPKQINLEKYPQDILQNKLKLIAGFEIEVKEWLGCFRLNQNRSEESRNHIKQHFKENEALQKAIDKFNNG